MDKHYDVFGLGSALMDILVMTEETELLKFNLKKGVMRLIEEKELKEILSKISHLNPVLTPGGSVANTCAGVVRLGGKSIFCGIVGKDEHGLLYEEKMQTEGVEVRLTKEEGMGLTGAAVTFITPDSERTFATHLGISIKLAKEHILAQDVSKCKIAHFEGYMLEGDNTREACLHVMDLAKENGTLVSLDVSDSHLIERILPRMKNVIEEKVDILFCNDTEAEALTGKGYSEAIKEIASMVDMAVVKLGKDGSIIRKGEEEVKVAGIKVDAVDTTGAGDMYASGFLYGIAHDLSLERSGKIASFAAAKVVERMGARLDFDLRKDVEKIN